MAVYSLPVPVGASCAARQGHTARGGDSAKPADAARTRLKRERDFQFSWHDGCLG
jgi:hypothetical protein